MKMIFFRTTNIFLRNGKLLTSTVMKKWYFNALRTSPILQRHLTLYGKYSSEDRRNYAEENFNNIEEEDVMIELTFNNLHMDKSDNLCEIIRNSTSIEEVLGTIESNHKNMTWLHVTQSLYVLSELQNAYFKMNGLHHLLKKQYFYMLPVDIKNSVTDLHCKKDFQLLLNMIENNYKDMDVKTLANNLLNLVKLGVSIKHKVPQLLVKEFQLRFSNGIFNLNAISTFSKVLFSERDLYSYYAIKDFIPMIYSSIDRCYTSEDIKALTNCLIDIHNIIPKDVLQQYKLKVNELLNNQTLNPKEYSTLVKIVLLLNHQQFRNESIDLMKKCMMLMENNIHYFQVYELLLLYEVFHKIHEPAPILNEIQRCANSHLQKLEEESNLFYYTHFRLMICLACFSSSKRLKLNSFLRQNINVDLNYKALQEYYKLLLISKCNDIEICQQFWDKLLSHVDEMEKENHNYIFEVYVNFYRKLYNFRYERVEETLNKIVDMEIQNGIDNLIPWKCAILATYVIAFSNNDAHMEYFLYKIKENIFQFSKIDLFNIAKGLDIGLRTKSHQHVTLMSVIRDVEKYVLENDIKLERANLLLHCYGWSSSYDKVFDQKIIEISKNDLIFSSQNIMNIIAVIEKTNLFLPNIIEEMCEYVVTSNYSIMGFIAEKLISLYYYLGYVPENPKFIEIVTNLLIRDERRLSSLSYIESALGLCFFQTLPDAMIKQIFNVEFLENIDNELMNCYHKDTYPFRVRHTLMQLNRAVCMDYPEKNVPWFHQNFVEYMKKYDKPSRTKLHTHVKKFLETLVKSGEVLEENVYTPYGYYVDFAVNKQDNRIAILLLEPSAFTKHHVQLKGECQLKIRHLEMLGYKVIIIKNVILQQMDMNEQIKYFEDIVK